MAHPVHPWKIEFLATQNATEVRTATLLYAQMNRTQNEVQENLENTKADYLYVVNHTNATLTLLRERLILLRESQKLGEVRLQAARSLSESVNTSYELARATYQKLLHPGIPDNGVNGNARLMNLRKAVRSDGKTDYEGMAEVFYGG